MIFRVFREIPKGDGLLDLGGELGGELVFELFYLVFECSFDVFHACGRLYEVRVGKEGRIGDGEEALEEEDGGDLVDEVLAVEAVLMAGAGAEKGVGVVGGEALVEEVEGESGVLFPQGVGEGEGLGGLRAWAAVGVERVADDQNFDVVLADEAGYGFQVGAELGAMHGEERLGGEAEGVGDGEADAFVAYVEG
jgi:hypothetical protein